ncbi:MAG: serine/threonine-protein kinase [Candidatus Xenobia bacterium]
MRCPAWLQLRRRQLGRYRLHERIGRGACAYVYRASPLDDAGQTVALKVMRSDLAHDPQYLRRFRREVKVMTELSHPAIVRVLDWGEADGVLYLVMEHLPGGTLRDVLPQNGLPLATFLPWYRALVDAVALVHRRGIVHRDLKSSNVLVSAQRELKISDFGLARGDDFTRLTGSAVRLGTPAYMAPEQYSEPEPQAAADQYALGILGFEMLVGALPFQGRDPAEMFRLHRDEPPPPLRRCRPDAPEALEAVLARMLEKAPEARHPALDGVVAALDAIASSAA